jgi:hypothetical protein
MRSSIRRRLPVERHWFAWAIQFDCAESAGRLLQYRAGTSSAAANTGKGTLQPSTGTDTLQTVAMMMEHRY